MAADPIVGVLMGSDSDLSVMGEAAEALTELAVAHEVRVLSAHRRPFAMLDYAAQARERGLRVLVAGAGGAAHLPGMLAAWTRLPVLGVPVRSRALSGTDSLLSIVQMPRGVPVGTLAIGGAGAANAALLAIRILALRRPELADRLERHARAQAEASEASELPTPDYRP